MQRTEKLQQKIKMATKKYRVLYNEGKSILAQHDIAEADLDARLLLEYVCKTDRNTLLVHGDREVSDEEQERYLDLIRKRGQHIPLQHLTGEQEFMGLTFKVNEHVLVPRQDTEILVEEVMKNLHDGMHILDMCTGSGCILLSLLQYSNDCTGVGVDLSEEALLVARENYARLKADKSGMQAAFVKSDLFAAFGSAEKDTGESAGGQVEYTSEKFDIVVSNPPYIKTDVIHTLMPEVRDHEPMMALDGREDGLYFYRKITADTKRFLCHGGMLFYEIGYDQAVDVQKIMEAEGFQEINVVQDFAGLDRVVYGVWL
jgi:release factor glutamine methyltransferase